MWNKYWCHRCKIWIDEQKCPNCGCISTYTPPARDDEDDNDGTV